MDAPIVASHFLELLEDSALIPAEEFRAFSEAHDLSAESTAQAVADAFLAAGLLTRFQTQRLLAGRARGFFFDRYKVLDAIGFGGMSRIYLAEDPRTAQRVALKVLAARYEHDAGMLARLKLEAHVGRRLCHPHVLRTRELGFGAGSHFLVMEYVEGIELLELIECRGRIPYPRACDFLSQAALGLAHAHQAGIVHRDVKPANLMIDCSGHVKLLDFGLASLGEESAEDEFSLSMIFGHNCLGTAYYMSPEQSRDSNAVEATADIYSLGCTLYHALTGQVPFPAADPSQSGAIAEVIDAQRHREAVPVGELVDDVPVALADLVARMMAKRPQDRVQSAAEVARSLACFARHEPIEVDVHEIVSQRMARARMRLSASQSGQSRSGTRVGSQRGLSSVAGSRARKSRVQGETAINHDTKPEHAVRANNPACKVVPVFPDAAQSPGDAAARVRQPLRRVVERPAVLLPIDGDAPLPLRTERILIGRDAECDVVFSTGQISGRHCELRCEEGRWRIVDLESKNGVQVNGKPVKEAWLRSGDRLTIAHSLRFVFRLVDERSSRRRKRLAWAVALGLAALGGAGWLLARLW